MNKDESILCFQNYVLRFSFFSQPGSLCLRYSHLYWVASTCPRCGLGYCSSYWSLWGWTHNVSTYRTCCQGYCTCSKTKDCSGGSINTRYSWGHAYCSWGWDWCLHHRYGLSWKHPILKIYSVGYMSEMGDEKVWVLSLIIYRVKFNLIFHAYIFCHFMILKYTPR